MRILTHFSLVFLFKFSSRVGVLSLFVVDHDVVRLDVAVHDA